MSQTWGAPPAPGMPPPPPPQYRRPGPPWGVIAAIVTGVCLLVAAVVGAALFVYTTTDDADDDRAAQVDLVTAPEDLASALDDERTVAEVTLLDMAEVVDLRIEDNAAARRRTDAALGAFDAAVADSEGPGARVYGDALAAFDELDALRGEVDGTPAQRGDLSFPRPIRDRYSELIAALLDANARFVDTIDDPELRQGARLFETGLQQFHLVRRLSAEIPEVAVGATPEWTVRVASLRAELAQGQAAVLEQATGDLARPVDRLDAALTAAGTMEHLDRVIETGQSEFAILLQSVGDTLRAWQTFLGEVEATLTRSG